MMYRQFLGMLILGLAIGLVGVGCAAGVKEVKVTGGVTLEGKPEEGATVVFAPTDPKHADAGRTARTDAAGKFETKLRAGSYAVVFSKKVDKKGKIPKESEAPTEDAAQLEASGYLREVYPARYTSSSSTPFKVDIASENKDLPPFALNKK